MDVPGVLNSTEVTLPRAAGLMVTVSVVPLMLKAVTVVFGAIWVPLTVIPKPMPSGEPSGLSALKEAWSD